MKKKGAINLSINMIIVLIIAIIILGFALSFITGMFGKAEDVFAGQFPSVEVAVNAQNPIGIGDELRLEDGEERNVNLKVFNKLDEPINTATDDPVINCKGGGADFSDPGVAAPRFSAVEPKTIESGQTGTLKVVLQGESGMMNNDLCQISFTDNGDGTGNGVQDTLTQTFFLVTQ